MGYRRLESGRPVGPWARRRPTGAGATESARRHAGAAQGAEWLSLFRRWRTRPLRKSQRKENSMSTEENNALVRRLIEEVWNQGHLAVFDELYAPDFLFH